MDLFEMLAALLVLSAVFAWVNGRFLGLPSTIGVIVVLAARLVAVGIPLTGMWMWRRT